MKTRRSIWILVLALSLGAHLLVLWLSKSSIPSSAPSQPFVVELEWIESNPPPPILPPEMKVDAPVRPEKPRAMRVPKAPKIPKIETAFPTEPLEPKETSDIPKMEPDVDTQNLDVPRVLIPRLTLNLDELDAGVSVNIVTARTGLRGAERNPNLVSDLVKETLGKDKVQKGLVHPYFSQVGKALTKNWDADRVAAAGLKGLIEQTGQNMKLLNEIWLDNAEQYGASGGAKGAPAASRRQVVNNGVAGTVGLDFETRREGAKALREQFSATRRSTIKVVQDLKGVVKSIELLSPSNDPNVDREALKDIKDRAKDLPVPPPEAIGNKTQLVSIWSFELIVSITPPVPTFTFEFDEVLGFVDARLPLDRRIYKRVRLVSVE